MNYPIPVAISAIISNNRILLIRRVRDGYEGFWSLPGGKVRTNEHVSETAVREVLEETGLESEFIEHLGHVSEHQVNGETVKHVILHLCRLEPRTLELAKKDDEGELGWFELDKIESIRQEMIPSDFLMIEKMVKTREKSYYNCIIETVDGEHLLRQFE